MLIFFPYRVKNPIKRFPYVTIAIIVANLIVFYFTSRSCIEIRYDIAEDYAYKLGTSPPLHAFYSFFLHGSADHILGNIFFLFIFGPSVEERLGIPRYLVLYFGTGLIANLVQASLDVAFFGGSNPGIGASGCIMGVMGAYWYLYPWSKVYVWYWVAIVYSGVVEVTAIYLIGIFILKDLASGLIAGGTGAQSGIASFAHVGGGVMGALFCMVMGMNRDTAKVSNAKAVKMDTRNLASLPPDTLEAMYNDDPADLEILRALVKSAIEWKDDKVIDRVMARAGSEIVNTAPDLAAYYLNELHGNMDVYPPAHLFRLTSRLEQTGDPVRALGIYRRIIERAPASPDAETALYRTALCYYTCLRDKNLALANLSELQRRFPNGEQAELGKRLAERINTEQRRS